MHKHKKSCNVVTNCNTELTAQAVRRKQLRTKKSLGDAPSGSGSRWLFTSITSAQRRNSTGKNVQDVNGIILTYTVNEFVSPRVKFLPKAVPVDCALLPFTLTRHFLSLSGGHQQGKRKRSVWEADRVINRRNFHGGDMEGQKGHYSSKFTLISFGEHALKTKTKNILSKNQDRNHLNYTGLI